MARSARAAPKNEWYHYVIAIVKNRVEKDP
jgi:hypothetical protein